MKSKCPGCGSVFEKSGGPTHAYFGESPECWKAFGEVLAREFQDKNYWKVHRLTVDTYAVQHPFNMDKRNIQSVNIHLMALHAVHDRKQSFDTIPPLLDTAAKRFKESFHYLQPPSRLGELTISDVLRATSQDEHCELVWKWSRSVWADWTAQRSAIEDLYKRTSILMDARRKSI